MNIFTLIQKLKKKLEKEVAIDYNVNIEEEYKFNILPNDTDIYEEIIKIENKIYDGWITLNLYYPVGATNKMWRLGEKGEIRTNLDLKWEYYTGPITIPMSRTKDIWIKYDLNNKTVIKAPTDSVLVYIDNKELTQNTHKVTITYDERAIVKEYNIDGTGWKNYEGEFIIDKTSLIMARAKIEEEIRDNSGNLIFMQDKWGEDNKYIIIN